MQTFALSFNTSPPSWPSSSILANGQFFVIPSRYQHALFLSKKKKKKILFLEASSQPARSMVTAPQQVLGWLLVQDFLLAACSVFSY